MSRNVEALARILGGSGIAPQHDSWCRVMARQLAASGVLAIDSLTDEQVEDIYMFEICGYAEEDLRAALRRCATGEAE